MSYRPNRGLGINPIWVIIGVDVVIFLASIIDQRGIIDARFGLVPAFLDHQPWTVFTYMFLHASWIHIIFNMLTFYFFGTFAMALIGETAFLMTFFVGGIVGGLFFFLFSYIPLPYFQATHYVLVVGASGAIYALGGLLIMLRPNVRVYTFPIPIPMPLWIAILVGFIFITFFPEVAWQAHLGGLMYGLLVGYYYRRREIRRY
jgi:membrane associated rhomboid family serine protease